MSTFKLASNNGIYKSFSLFAFYFAFSSSVR